jgi:hypothetical protein
MNNETKTLLIEGLDCMLVQLKPTAIESDLEDTTALKKIIKIQELKESLHKFGFTGDSKETAG